jgi:hypothetical protein
VTFVIPFTARRRLAKLRAGVERLGRTAFGVKPSWRRLPNTLPWFDRPDADRRATEIAAEHDVDATVLERWVRDGYVVIDGGIDEGSIDDMVDTLDRLWEAPVPIEGLTLLDLRTSPDASPRDYPHAELLSLDRDTRLAMRTHSNWRVHGFHYVYQAAHRIFNDPRLRALVAAILDRPVQPIAAINFMRGSEQALHQDMAVFHIYPHNHLVGAWIACEEVGAAAGPLVLYRGSHRTPLYPGFTDYPQTNLRTVTDEQAAAYDRWVEAQALRYEREEFHARKGQILLWHGMLIHGGAPVRHATTSRKSMVLHYASRGTDRGREVSGPFRW